MTELIHIRCCDKNISQEVFNQHFDREANTYTCPDCNRKVFAKTIEEVIETPQFECLNVMLFLVPIPYISMVLLYLYMQNHINDTFIKNNHLWNSFLENIYIIFFILHISITLGLAITLYFILFRDLIYCNDYINIKNIIDFRLFILWIISILNPILLLIYYSILLGINTYIVPIDFAFIYVITIAIGIIIVISIILLILFIMGIYKVSYTPKKETMYRVVDTF